MTQYQVAYLDGAFRVYATGSGIDRRYFEPPFTRPREAIAYSDQLDGRAAATGAGQGAGEGPVVAPDGGSRSDVAPVAAQRPSQTLGLGL